MTSKLKVDEIVDSTDTGSPSFPYGVTFAGAVSGTSASLSGNLTFTGTGNRITGDFSNATLASRVMFQTSTTNGATQIAALPNGTGTSSNFAAHNASDPTNASRARIQVSSTDVSFLSDISGTGTYLPMTFYTGGSERVRIDTSGNVGIGTSSPTIPLDVVSDSNAFALRVRGRSSDNISSIQFTDNIASTQYAYIRAPAADTLSFATATTERMRIDSSGNVGIGTSSPGARLDVAVDSTSYIKLRGRASDNLVSLQFVNSSNSVQQGYILSDGNPNMVFGVGTSERMRIDSSGNVGIGTSSFATASAGRGVLEINGSSESIVTCKIGNTVYGYIQAQTPAFNVVGSATALMLQATGANIVGFVTNGSERMRVSNDGKLRINRTTDYDATQVAITPTNNGIGIEGPSGTSALLTNYAGAFNLAVMRISGTQYGIISTSTSGTTYGTSSDYRLKNIEGELTNSGSYIDALRPVHGTWKTDGSKFIGLIAHEVQESSQTKVVIGTKDEVDADGKPVYQAMDYSNAELIANLIAEVKSLRKRVAQLEGA